MLGEPRHCPPRDAHNRFLAQPLPRRSPPSDLNAPYHATDGAKYDLIIVGAGPSGSFLNLILARYGLDSVLCIDTNCTATQVGHADGIVPRTIEVLAAFGLEHDVLRYGRHAVEQATWKRQPASDGKPGGIVRESRMPFAYAGINGRFNDGIFYGMHQGHVERIFEDDLALYTDRTVQRNTRLVSVRLDDSDTEYPVQATLQSTTDGTTYPVRAKYLVGADGAHSAVRNSLGIRMEGDSTDDIFGVIDLVPQTDYPDIHRVGTIMTDEGTVLHVVREIRRDGYPLIRMYVPLETIDATAPSNDDASMTANEQPNGTATEPTLSNPNANNLPSANDKPPPRRHDYSHITPTTILARANTLLHPYTLAPHPASPAIDWSTVYRVGQRVAAHQVWPPPSQSFSPSPPRIFLLGDASHTHSPKAGQGLNVSLQDAHNLAWKLAYVLLGLVPAAESVERVLASYEAERGPVARDLVELDRLWYGARYKRVRDGGDGGTGKEGKEGAGKVDPAVLLGEMLGFIGGFGVEYTAAVGGGDENRRSTSILVDAGEDGKAQEAPADAAELAALKAGRLRVGRRLPEAKCVRYADGGKVWLQSECDGRGCWWVVVFAGEDLGGASSAAAVHGDGDDVGDDEGGRDGKTGTGRSVAAMERLVDVQKSFVKGTVRSVVLHTRKHLSFEWADLPGWVRKEWEMGLLGFEDAQEAYGMFGVKKSEGRIVLVRPDGYVAAVERLSVDGVGRLEGFLGRVCARSP